MQCLRVTEGNIFKAGGGRGDAYPLSERVKDAAEEHHGKSLLLLCGRPE